MRKLRFKLHFFIQIVNQEEMKYVSVRDSHIWFLADFHAISCIQSGLGTGTGRPGLGLSCSFR